MTRRFLPLLAVALAAFTAACSPLSAFNTFVPKDGASRAAAQGLAYGDNARQKLDVYVPSGPTKAAARPVVVFFYGGAWSSGRRQDYAFAGRALAAQGFVTVVPDYRLYPEVRFPDFLKDSAQAVRFVRDHARDWGGDPNSLVLAGHSAGAYIAAMLALDRSLLNDAGVPSGSVRAWAGLSGPYDFLPLDDPSAINALGSAADPVLTQPIHFVHRGAPPAFLAHGDADERVEPRNSRSLATRLQQAEVPVQLKLYPGLEHTDTLLALSKPLRGKAPVLADLVRFLRDQAGIVAVP